MEKPGTPIEVAIPEQATKRLASLHARRVRLEEITSSYLEGACAILGIDPARVRGLDDSKSVLLVSEADED